MKVFICWSGEGSASHKAAQALHQWIQVVFSGVQPFLSSSDIEGGEVWDTRLGEELKATSFGIVCITPANKESRWMHFEAGAIAKLVEKTRLVPFVLGLPGNVLEKPLGRFQLCLPTEEDLRKLATGINDASDEQRVGPDVLRQRFDAFWPGLNTKLQEIVELAKTETEPPSRSTRLHGRGDLGVDPDHRSTDCRAASWIRCGGPVVQG